MALTFAAVKVEADAAVILANEIVTMHARISQYLEHNSDLAIDWTAGSTPAYITEDGAGNITGYTFTRQAVGNVIGSLDQFRRMMTNQTVTQGDHLGNVDQLARPLG